MDLWIATSAGLVRLGSDEVLFADRVVTSLTPSPGGVLAVVDGNRLFRVSASGTEAVAGSDGVRLNCILIADGTILAGAADARLLLLTDGTLVAVPGFDAAPGRDEWYTPWGGPPDVRSLAAAPGGALLANVHVGGILRSDDAGVTWNQTIDIHSDIHEVIAPDEGRFLAACSWGFASSSDGGASWDFSTEGLHASYCRAVATSGDHVFLTASVGPHGGRAALYRKRYDDAAFGKCDKGLPEWFGDNIDTGCLVVSGDEVAFGTSDGSVFVSSDSGDSWEAVAESLAPVRWLALA